MNAVHVPLSVLDRLRKVHALAERGHMAERIVAAEKLRVLLAKYGLTLESLLVEEPRRCAFKWRGKHEKQLLIQCICQVTGRRTFKSFSAGGTMWVLLPPAQEVDARECFAHYRKALRQLVEDSFLAFIQANEIFAADAPEDKTEDCRMNAAQLLRIVHLLQGMESNPWKKRLSLVAGGRE